MRKHINIIVARQALRAVLCGVVGLMAAPAEATLRVVGSEAQPGGLVAVEVRTDTPLKMAALEATVNFDGMLLDCLGATNLPGMAGAPLQLAYENDDHRVTVRMYEADGEAMVLGTGTLFQVTFLLNAGAKPGMEGTVTWADQSTVGKFGLLAAAEGGGPDRGGLVWAVYSSAVDSDGDGLSDYEEQMINGSADYAPDGGDTDINNADSDGDGMPDGWEHGHGLDPTISGDEQGQDGNPDGDPMRNIDEWTADTDPMDGTSYLAITNVFVTGGMARISWQGGVQSWQYLECSSNLVGEPAPWTAILTNPPPTERSESILDAGATGGTLFYRIKAERP